VPALPVLPVLRALLAVALSGNRIAT
jgi:hypothetical protein